LCGARLVDASFGRAQHPNTNGSRIRRSVDSFFCAGTVATHEMGEFVRDKQWQEGLDVKGRGQNMVLHPETRLPTRNSELVVRVYGSGEIA
jgi:hypothetical protein